MKYVLLFLLALFTNHIYSQESNDLFRLTYVQDIFSKRDTMSLSIGHNCSLYSSYSDTGKERIDYTENTTDKENYRFNITIDTDIMVFKSNGTVISNEYVLTKKYTVIDSLNIIDWNITSETLDIMGFTAFKAKGIHKGREYSVWFTPDIPISNGPWKFIGLPGLIIKVEDEEKKVFYDLIEITQSEKFDCSTSENMLTKITLISRNEYENLWKEKIENLNRYISSSISTGEADINTSINVELVEKSIFDNEY